VGYEIYYPSPIPTQPAYDRDEVYPEANRASDTVLSIPVHPRVDEEDIETVVRAVEAGTQMAEQTER